MLKRNLIISLCFVGLAAPVFAAFPITLADFETIAPDPDKFQLDMLGFVLGMLTFWLLPYSLLLLLVDRKFFRKSVILGWLTGLVMMILVIFLFFFGPPLIY